MRQDTNEIVWIDVVRFFSSLAIVVYHFYDNVPLKFKTETTNVIVSFLPHAVDLFFLISGFIIANFYYSKVSDLGSYRNFMVKRVARLFPLYYLTLAFFLTIGLAYHAGFVVPNNPDSYHQSCILPHLTLTQSFGFCGRHAFNYVSWSVGAEFFLYLMFPLFPMLFRSRSLLFTWVAVLIVSLELYCRWRGGSSWTIWSWNFGFARALVGFSIGVLVYRSSDFLSRALAGRRLLLMIPLFAGLVYMSQYGEVFAAFAAYILAVSAIFARGGESSGAVGLFAYLGQLTYSMYMLHPVVQVLFLSVFSRKVLHADENMMLVLVFAAVGLVIAVSQISNMAFEQPLRRKITKVFSRR